ncbi:hypothetical protein HKX48_003447 [Thoreauomyces humboldtii]|nr:hypothetical protein HKX48_003447 [Thoreauomyces humboldtii]
MSAAQTLVQTSRIAFVNLVSSLVPSLSDYDCAVCLGTMYEPVQLSTCKHRFCRECLHQHEQFSAFWAYLYWIDVQCPICRGSYTGRHKVLDGAMDNLIKTYFPREHKEKSRDEFRRRMKRKIVMLMRRRIIWRDSLWE